MRIVDTWNGDMPLQIDTAVKPTQWILTQLARTMASFYRSRGIPTAYLLASNCTHAL